MGSKKPERLAISKDLVVKSFTEEIKSVAKEVVRSKKSVNELLKLFSYVEDDTKEEVVLACIRAFHKVFCHYLDANELQIHTNENNHADSSQVKVRQWIRERYTQAVEQLITWINHSSQLVQELSVCTLMKFVEAESKHPLDPQVQKTSLTPAPLLERVIHALLTSEEDKTSLINRFQEYLEYDDVRYFYMKFAQSMVNEMKQEDEDDTSDRETKLSNTLSGLMILSLPSNNEKLEKFLLSVKKGGNHTSVKVQRDLYTKLWLSFVKLKLSAAIYKRILIALPDRVIPHLNNPLVLSDWLITLYNYGGAVSLMALNGLFVLMNSHNLEYPDFYTKLYNIMGNEIFQAKYKARFFHLLDKFLMSLLLPSYIVTAFVKKLSRMALTAPPGGTLLIIELVINLLIRHDTCRALIHRDTPCNLETDPYLPEETNLKLCKASDSSLWEIKSLQNHWFHRISSQAHKIEKPLPAAESTLDELLETNFEELLEKEVKKSKKVKAREEKEGVHVPVNHILPKGLLGWETEALTNLWCVKPANQSEA